jgi:hypothetical protein
LSSRTPISSSGGCVVWWGATNRPKEGADRGIDGRLHFREGDNADTKQIAFSVKAGSLTVAHVRELRGVVEREKGEIGVLLSMEEPTKAMRGEAASARARGCTNPLEISTNVCNCSR